MRWSLKSFFKDILKLNSLSANPTKWWNTLKQFVGNLPTNCLSVFDHFVGLVLERVKHSRSQKKRTKKSITTVWYFCTLPLHCKNLRNLCKNFWTESISNTKLNLSVNRVNLLQRILRVYMAKQLPHWPYA